MPAIAHRHVSRAGRAARALGAGLIALAIVAGAAPPASAREVPADSAALAQALPTPGTATPT